MTSRLLALVADDDADILMLVSLTLERDGYDVVTARDGLTALQTAQTRLPHLAVLDLMMPGIDGCEVTRRLRAREATAAIPIVILTAKAMTAQDKARLNGQISYLAEKGQFNPTTFVELVRRFCPAPTA